jgi:hypothetical protein
LWFINSGASGNIFSDILRHVKFAGVVKLVDALDSKSSEPCVRVGSIPTSGTKKHPPILSGKSFERLSANPAESLLIFWFNRQKFRWR